MRQLARRECILPIVRGTAVAITIGAGANREAQAGLIRRFLSEHCAFVRDPADIELLTAPAVQLTTIRQTGMTPGDCDDVAVLAASLALAIGLRARFVAVGRRAFEHVFTVVGDGRHWWELDVTRPFQDIPEELQRNVLTLEV